MASCGSDMERWIERQIDGLRRDGAIPPGSEDGWRVFLRCAARFRSAQGAAPPGFEPEDVPGGAGRSPGAIAAGACEAAFALILRHGELAAVARISDVHEFARQFVTVQLQEIADGSYLEPAHVVDVGIVGERLGMFGTGGSSGGAAGPQPQGASSGTGGGGGGGPMGSRRDRGVRRPREASAARPPTGGQPDGASVADGTFPDFAIVRRVRSGQVKYVVRDAQGNHLGEFDDLDGARSFMLGQVFSRGFGH